MKYAVIFERTPRNYSAYVPDLPGCVATGRTIRQTERLISEAIRMHVEGLRAQGLPVPEAQTSAAIVEA